MRKNFLFFLLALTIVTQLSADTFIVTKTGDSFDLNCDADCSLREAIEASNNNAGFDTVILPAGTYVLSLAGAGEDANQTGDLDITDDLFIEGAGQSSTVIDADGIDRVLDILNGMVEILDVTITGGDGTVDNVEGGGIANDDTLTLRRCTVAENQADGGGGIENNGDLTLIDSTVSNNTAISADGGGIGNNATMTLNRVTLSGNDATPGGEEGGGISTSHFSAAVSLTNCTLSGNQAGAGGGIAIGSGVVQMLNCTIADNIAIEGPGVHNRSTLSFEPTNTIVADGCSSAVDTVSGGGNMEAGDTCGFTDTSDQANVGAAALNLGPLADNGGFTRTHALLLGSAAIDSALNNACPAEDQRDIMRPIDGDGDMVAICDIGAYEAESLAPVPTLSVWQLLLLAALMACFLVKGVLRVHL
ncbi:choice-of-anchor Q domain-containing protein [Acidobacteriota bacterium]